MIVYDFNTLCFCDIYIIIFILGKHLWLKINKFKDILKLVHLCRTTIYLTTVAVIVILNYTFICYIYTVCMLILCAFVLKRCFAANPLLCRITTLTLVNYTIVNYTLFPNIQHDKNHIIINKANSKFYHYKYEDASLKFGRFLHLVFTD